MRGGCAVAFAGLFLCVGGSLVAQGGTTNVVVGGCFIVVVVVVVLLVLLVGGNDRRKHGLRGEAQVLSAEETGLQINDRPVVRLRLRVQGPGIEPFETECKPVVPLTGLGKLSGGGPLTVWFDPEDHTKFDIDWTIAPTAGGEQTPAVGDNDLTTAERLRRLAELRAADVISADEYAGQRARILGEL